MAKHISFWNAALVIAPLISAPLAELAAADVATSDQDGRQDPDQMCESAPDCTRVVDPRIEPDQDQKVEPSKVIDPGVEQEPDHERIIDPVVAPIEELERKRLIDPPGKIDPDGERNPDRLSTLEVSQKQWDARMGSVK